MCTRPNLPVVAGPGRRSPQPSPYDRWVRRAVFPILVTLAAVGTIVGTFLPWLRSGKHDRTSYQLLSLLDTLGYASEGPVGWAVRLWPLVPLICVVASVASWRGMWPISSLAGVGGGAYALGLALVVRSANSTSLLYARWGATFTLVSALVLTGASLAQAGDGMRQFIDDEADPDRPAAPPGPGSTHR